MSVAAPTAASGEQDDRSVILLVCTSVVHDHHPTDERTGEKRKHSETATFGDAEVPLDVHMNRRHTAHVHTTDPAFFGCFQRGRFYAFRIEEIR